MASQKAKPAHRQSFPELRREFAAALQIEIETVKKKSKKGSIQIVQGRLHRESGGAFIYRFLLESFLATIDDTPAEIEIGGNVYDCQIISVEGLQVELGIMRNVGAFVPQARLTTSNWQLLEILRKKFAELDDSEAHRFSISDSFFAGRFTKGSELPDLKDHPHLNGAQRLAVQNSFSNSLAIIWGPPGTGKTKTIASAIETHLRAGRRVLLVSHANTAVDEALEGVADRLKDSDLYKQGKLVRLGLSRKDTLPQKYPLVILDEIVAARSKDLTSRKQSLIEEHARLTAAANEYRIILKSHAQAMELGGKRDALNEQHDRLGLAGKAAEQDVVRVKSQIERLKSFASATGLKANMRRLLAGHSKESLYRQIEALGIQLLTHQRKVVSLQDQMQVVRNKYAKARNAADEALNQVQAVLEIRRIEIKQVGDSIRQLNGKLISINREIELIDGQLDDIKGRVLVDAQLVATTLTKTYTDRQFVGQSFNVIILDEASMAPLPQLYWAAHLATDLVTVVGDFNQLPPICQTDNEELTNKWLARSIFDVLGVGTVAAAKADNQRVTLLDTQYRMTPDISRIANILFYDNMLKDAPAMDARIESDSILANASLGLIDTSKAKPWCNRLRTRSRINLYSANACASLARKLLETSRNNEFKIGIVSPYKAQAQYIGKIIEDWGLTDRVRVNTVHSFQGAESFAIIFDCTDGRGTEKNRSMLDDENSNRLLNVVITRAQYKFFMVADCTFLESRFREQSNIRRIVQMMISAGNVVPLENVVDGFGDVLDSTADDLPMNGFHTHKDFWTQFYEDLKRAEKSVVIMSAFIAIRRAESLLEHFRELRQNGVKISIYTRPPQEHSGKSERDARHIIDELKKLDVEVIERPNMHEKIATIDGTILWQGSLNILSHNNSGEQMYRLQGKKAVQDAVQKLELHDRDYVVGELSERICPSCKVSLVVRDGKKGKFFGCTNFGRMKCRYTEEIGGESPNGHGLGSKS